MKGVVLDASAILAVIQRETGYERLTPQILDTAAASAVNLAEVQARLRNRGWNSEEAWEDATSPVREIVPFSVQQARAAGDMALETRALGLSLGDRACLTLALERNAVVYTADRAWKNLTLNLTIEIIR
jgi:ribonuclease VapC